MQTAEQCWAGYRRLLPADASPVQLAETKRAFMAGMLEHDRLLSEIANLPDGDDMDALAVVSQELLDIAVIFVIEGNRGPTN